MGASQTPVLARSWTILGLKMLSMARRSNQAFCIIRYPAASHQLPPTWPVYRRHFTAIARYLPVSLRRRRRPARRVPAIHCLPILAIGRDYVTAVEYPRSDWELTSTTPPPLFRWPPTTSPARSLCALMTRMKYTQTFLTS